MLSFRREPHFHWPLAPPPYKQLPILLAELPNRCGVKSLFRGFENSPFLVGSMVHALGKARFSEDLIDDGRHFRLRLVQLERHLFGRFSAAELARTARCRVFRVGSGKELFGWSLNSIEATIRNHDVCVRMICPGDGAFWAMEYEFAGSRPSDMMRKSMSEGNVSLV